MKPLFVAASAATVFGALTGREWLQYVAKPLIAPALAADVIRSGELTTERKLLVGGLAAATVGDVILVAPDDDRRLIAGASSFGVMQTAYATVLLRHRAKPTVAAAAPRVAGWLGAAMLLRRKAPRVATPLTVYGITLATATTLASDPALAPGAETIGGLAVPNADPRSRLGVGALLFTVSDALIVARKLFARNETQRRIVEGVILATYAGAQYCLVGGMNQLPLDLSP